jgi:serine/threonine-protein kinase
VILREGGAMPLQRGLHIAGQVCAGLCAAHAKGIIHRDVKPGNALIGDGDIAKILDFGLAAITCNVDARLTKSGLLVGTPQYMAPEQIKGDTVDARSDIYSLGMMMYEMFTGVQPVECENPVAMIYKHLEGDIPPIDETMEDCPPALAKLIMRALSLDPDGRQATMREFLDELKQVYRQAA